MADVISLDRRASMLRALRPASEMPPVGQGRARAPRTKLSREWFVRGPFPGRQFEIAAKLPGKALLVWQLVQHQCRLSRKDEITLRAALLERVGVSVDVKLRALRTLERAGLITVARGKGRSPRIRLMA